MPDRVVRQDILTSDSVNSLSWAAEIFYRRLMSLADDYGRYEARPSLLRASLYPLKLDRVSEPDVVKWMGECSEAGLVRVYTVNGREYVEILKFGQRLRAMKSRYPAPDGNREHSPSSADICQQMLSTAGRRRLKRNESESETESETETKEPAGAAHSPELISEYEKFQNWIISHAPRVGEMKESFTIDQFVQVKEKFSAAQISQILEAMHNWEPLIKKNRSAYLTAIKWLKKEDHATNQRPSPGSSSVKLGTSAAKEQAARDY
jgi:hypothetical protein